MSGWGSTPWGSGSWGSGSAGGVSVESAAATGERTVMVRFTGAVLQTGPTAERSALNPARWTVTRVVTGESLLVLAVRAVVPEVVELLTLQRFGSYLDVHRATQSGVYDLVGAACVSPYSADFLGCGASQTRQANQSLVDLRNNPTPRSPAGELIVDAAGDYALQEGADLLRKLILRRLTTGRGGFTHLPAYGVGLAEKEPPPSTDMASLRAEIEQQVLKEPDVVAAQCKLRLTANGILYVGLVVQRTSGDMADLSFNVPLSGG